MLRRQFLAIAGLGAFIPLVAPSRAEAHDPPPSEVVTGYLGAWNSHDVEATTAFFADDIVYFDAAVGSALEGRAAARRGVVENFMNAAPDCRWVMTATPFVLGEQVSFWWRFSGTNTGAWADGTPASGRGFDFSGRSFAEIRRGLIHYQADYYDATDLYR